MSGAAAADREEPPALTNGRERLSRLAAHLSVDRRRTAGPTFALRQVDDLIVLRVQHRLLLTTVLQ